MKVATHTTAQVSMMKNKTYLYSSKSDSRSTTLDQRFTFKRADQQPVQTHQYTAVPSGEMEISTYQAEPKVPKKPKRQMPASISTTPPIASSNIETSAGTTKPKNNIANLRRAWIRDNMTLHKHPSALEAGSLVNITNPTNSSATREARSLTPEKNPKPIKLQISGYNTTTQCASLETNL